MGQCPSLPQPVFQRRKHIGSAIRHQDIELLRRLLPSLPVKLLNAFYHRETALQFVSKFGDTQVVRDLLQYGADPDRTMPDELCALTRTIIFNQSAVFQVLLGEGSCNPNLACNSDGVTPLMYAVMGSRLFAFDALLTHPGISLDAVDSKGMTALHHAASSRSEISVAFVERLLDAGARVDVLSDFGTPLHLAVRSTAKISLLINSLARNQSTYTEKLNATDPAGLNVLHRAVLKEQHQSVLLLLSLGASFDNIPASFTERLLAMITVANHPTILRHLLLSMRDPTPLFFISMFVPSIGLLDMALILRRMEIAWFLHEKAACLPISRTGVKGGPIPSIARQFNTVPSLQSICRLNFRRSFTLRSNYESAVYQLDLPVHIINLLLFYDIEHSQYESTVLRSHHHRRCFSPPSIILEPAFLLSAMDNEGRQPLNLATTSDEQIQPLN